MSFKVGDRVRVLRPERHHFESGEIGIIGEGLECDIRILVESENPTCEDGRWYTDISNLELVEEVTKQAIDTSGKYVRAVYELVDLSIKGENFTLDMGEIKELIKELQELV